LVHTSYPSIQVRLLIEVPRAVQGGNVTWYVTGEQTIIPGKLADIFVAVGELEGQSFIAAPFRG